ncbi:radical SAM protein [Alloacidobacterium dinghuense]|uniref:Radical SAM protein n=1 Tax=Alloacidobacterium dinghuense TaxID=2763107 RepID=A0A7G8BMI8_9BACT|nr:radical SAM protein [Alloacidobacterium dinghuense]QNI33758.1 radical SAM protein [Alloacidobacterium dinghuense]
MSSQLVHVGLAEIKPTLLASDRLQKLPILILNVHERCNCRCLMCDIWKRSNAGELTTEELTRHRESIINLGVRQVVLTGGEPLLHSHLEALCSFLRECGVTITLLSTGLLLKKRAELVATLTDEVIVSLDGPEEIHDRVRRVRGGFQLIRDGILALRQLNPSLPIRGRSTVQRANYSSLRQTVQAARSLGLDSISFLAADVTSQAFNRELVWPGERQNEIALSATEILVLEREIDLLISEHGNDFNSRFIVESPEKLRRIARHFRAHLGQVSSEAPKCNAPWVSAVVEVDGSVRPCFFHPKTGSLEASTLEEALNNEEARAFRSTLNVQENSTCKRCVCSLHYTQAS